MIIKSELQNCEKEVEIEKHYNEDLYVVNGKHYYISLEKYFSRFVLYLQLSNSNLVHIIILIRRLASYWKNFQETDEYTIGFYHNEKNIIKLLAGLAIISYAYLDDYCKNWDFLKKVSGMVDNNNLRKIQHTLLNRLNFGLYITSKKGKKSEDEKSEDEKSEDGKSEDEDEDDEEFEKVQKEIRELAKNNIQS